jgi:hypothetical protein
MLPLVARDHIDRLLQEIEIELLLASARREVEISVYKSLRTGIEQGVNVALVPARLFDRLKFPV